MRYLKCTALTVAALIIGFTALPAAAQNANPEALSVAKGILEASHASNTIDRMLAQMFKVFSTSLNQANPGKAKEVVDMLNQVILPEFHAGLPDLMDQTAQTYANNFTVAELKQILAFYQSDIGRKLVGKLPEILREQSLVGQAFGHQVMERVQQKMLKAIQERGLQKPNGL